MPHASVDPGDGGLLPKEYLRHFPALKALEKYETMCVFKAGSTVLGKL